jgi:catechol 2,3-dioxygenase-like lactoylglutathione lyase family enzyme
VYDASKLFHIGIRVPDIDQAMAEIGAAMGVTWASVQDREMSVWLPDHGPASMRLALTYSVEGPVHLELLQGPPGSIWDGADAPGAHHFGVWSDDVGGETRRLLAAGWTLELAAAAPEDGFGRFSYVRSPTGFLLEPVSVASRPRFERWWAGGSLTDPIA